jgi:hypothetical protein
LRHSDRCARSDERNAVALQRSGSLTAKGVGETFGFADALGVCADINALILRQRRAWLGAPFRFVDSV